MMDEVYRPAAVERQAQAFWSEHGTFTATEDAARPKFYCLSMFPYPSGRLHMGHVRNYTIGDVIARYQRMQGRNVLQPMGWDAFGLPAENAAMQHGVPPAQWTRQNIAQMRAQLQRLGFGYDWQRELATCDPDYYRWEQWLFCQMLERGLVYRRNAVVNWDPVDQTVLANEQVIDGRGWRSGAPVERREIPQWFLRITAYADELLAELDALPGWPEAVKTMQRNWIGRSEGVEVQFALAGQEQPLTVYTTRPDTLMGVSYLAVAADHPLALAAASRDAEVADFVEACRRGEASEAALETLPKRGVDLGVRALHPLTGEEVPVWAANFVLMSYGTGAVMAVPAHDARDWEFARAYGLPVRQVIAPLTDAAVDTAAGAFTAPGRLINSGSFDGLTSEAAFEAIAARLAALGRGERRVNYRLRDWGVSRQRYWGAPIPVIYCERCGALPVPTADLPVVLPEDVVPTGSGSPLVDHPAFRQVDCPGCGGAARRETDTFDTFMESSWYFARFACAGNGQAMLDARADYWLPVDQYVGGIEHAILHLLYARFLQKVLRDLGLARAGEPFANLLTQGMVVAETYYRETEEGKRVFFSPEEVEVQRDGRGAVAGAVALADGRPVSVGGIEKMSKSKRNGVDPEGLIERYGADTVRLFTMFAAPPEQSLEWSDSGVEGASRFLKRLWRLTGEHLAGGEVAALAPAQLAPAQAELRRLVHQTIAKVGDDLGRRYTFNTAIAAVMELVNALQRDGDGSPQGRAVRQEGLQAVVLLLAPIVPHVAHVLWQALGGTGTVADASWPQADPAALASSTTEYVVQVNGKLRARLSVPVDASQAQVEQAAREDENVQRFIADRTVRKCVVVPGRLVNFVV